MKNVLIVGKNSYIGEYFASYVKNEFNIDIIDSVNNSWKKADFSKYDVVFHVAAIVHIKASNNNEALYYKINTDLAIEVAKHAKEFGVNQFIFMSSMSVYRVNKNLKKQIITNDTIPNPESIYGKSKLLAEQGLLPLQDEKFNIAVLRTPMIYGKGCKGNYPRLASIAKKLPFFPDFQSERSMLYIENLCEFIKLTIINESSGIFYPQNKEYTNISNLVKLIANNNGKKLHLVKGFGLIIKLMSKVVGAINKVFGSLVYDQNMSNHFEWEYAIKTLDESIKISEDIDQ